MQAPLLFYNRLRFAAFADRNFISNRPLLLLNDRWIKQPNYYASPFFCGKILMTVFAPVWIFSLLNFCFVYFLKN